MATDLEKLVVQLSADIKQYQRGMQDAMGVTNKQARAIEARWRQANKNLDGIGRGMAQSLIAPLAGIGAAIGTREIMSYADSWTRAGNLIAAAGQVAGRSGRSLEGINQIAQDTRAGFSETAELYARILRSTAGVADSEKEVASATEIVNKAFKAGGAGASEMAAGILQLSQGLGSGVLQGDELRSVRENAPLLAQAIADYFGVTVAGLKKLGEEGKLTSDKVFKAILASKSKIDAAFNATSQTIEDAVTRVNNAFTQYIGQSDEGLGASGRLIAGLNALADDFDHVADVTLKVASIIAGALVGRSIAGMIGKLGLATSAVTTFVAALRTASIATAIGGIGAAAGPLGLLIGGTVATALALYYTKTQDATVGSKEYAAALKQVENAAKAAAPAIKAATDSAGSDAGFSGAHKKAADELVSALQPAQQAVQAFIDLWKGSDAAGDAQLAKIQKLLGEVAKGEAPVSSLKSAIEELGRLNAFAKIASDLNALLGGIDAAAGKFDKLNKQLKLNQMEKQFAPFQAEAQYDETQRKIAKAAKDYIDDATRRSKLTKDQLELEEEIARVKKDASGKSVQLSDAQAKEAAKVNLAGNDRRSAEGKKVARTADSRFEQDIQGVKDRTAALIEEQKIIGLDTEKQEARRLALDLQQATLKRLREEARQKGVTDLDSIKLSDEQRAKIEAVAAAYGKQYAELEKLNGPLASFARQSADVGKALDASLANSLDRMADDLADVVLQTKSVGDAFKAMTDLILKEIIKIALKKAILGPIAGLFSGGLGSLGNLFGIGARASGGPVTAGQPYIVGEKRPELFVPSQNGMIVPQVPTMKGGRGSNSFNVTISMAGANGDATIRQIAAQATLQGSRAVLAQVPGMAVKAVSEHMRRAG
ncbi:MAG: tape measure protein [Xanthobacteraceae bacterium]